MSLENHGWEAVAASRREQIYRKIPNEWHIPVQLCTSQAPVDIPYQCGFLSIEELRITETCAIDILRALRARALTAVEVTLAFCKRAAIAHQLTNCLAEVHFEEALARATELDDYMHEHGEPVGPLHGLPISIKEHIHATGTTATSGLIAWSDQKCLEDALIVATFRKQGAVFHAKTTNPQSLMALETMSHLFGRTLNPHNKNLTCGGSTGGEAALIAMRGSPLGIGTDIGGSIRVPSAFCGTYGFKPSTGRVPHSGLSGLHDGMQNVVGSVGPLANCLEDIDLFMSAALQNEPWLYEPAVIEKSWKRLNPSTRPLRIGVMWDDGMVHPHPPLSRALRQTVESLQISGHTIVYWPPDLHAPLFEVINRAYFLDGGEEYRQRLREGNEPPVFLLETLLKAREKEPCSLQDSWRINIEIDRLRTAYSKRWNDQQLDCIICPASPSVASVHDETLHWGYTCVWNALDYPVSCIPVGYVEPTDTCTYLPKYQKNSFGPMDDWYQQLYSGPSRYRGAPISIQIVGRRLQEEKLLSMSTQIEHALRLTAKTSTSKSSGSDVWIKKSEQLQQTRDLKIQLNSAL